MNFNQFLMNISSPDFWLSSPNICFVSDEFNLLFFNYLFLYLEENGCLPYPKMRIDLDNCDQKTLRASIYQTILGNKSVFWLGNIDSDGSSKIKKNIISDLSSYKGPHHIIYFLPKDSKLVIGDNILTVEIPSQVDLKTAGQIFNFFYKKSIQSPRYNPLIKIFKQVKTMQLDLFCMIVNYVDLMSRKNDKELDSYLEEIIQFEPSLNQLSEFFFTNNSIEFYTVWNKLEKKYSDMFWIAFWSEQFWRAYHVVLFLKNNNFVNAKRISFRLPYSFINLYWKKFTIEKLLNLYQQIYDIDTKIKNGCAGSSLLDLFFCSYFLKNLNFISKND